MPARIDGLGAFKRGLQRQKRSMQARTPRGVTQAAHFVEGVAKQLLSLTSHPPGTPTPSQPGQPPSLISGALRRSITVDGPTPLGEGQWVMSVGPTIVYGRIQELGGRAGNGATLPARPYMQPAYDALPAQYQVFMEDAWTGAIT